MANDNLDYYKECFDKLNCAYSKKLGYAPHKPILLMSIIKLFANNHYKTSELSVTLQLEQIFENEWGIYVKTAHTINLAQPFYHLKNEPFWQLKTKGERSDFENKNKMKTLSNLKKSG